jgi:hypothetical protein
MEAVAFPIGTFRDPRLDDVWPIDRSGPLPTALDDAAWIGEAFFRHHPSMIKRPASAVRRALKQAAKRLALSSQSLDGSIDQAGRDAALAYMFAASPVGRNEVGRVELHVEPGRAARRSGRARDERLARNFAEVLWARYATDPAFKPMEQWIVRHSVPRLDLGPKDAFYLTAATLRRAVATEPAPLPLDDLDIARIVLIFAGILPVEEAADLIEAAAELGVEHLRVSDGESAEQLGHGAGSDAELDATRVPPAPSAGDLVSENAATLDPSPPAVTLAVRPTLAPVSEDRPSADAISSEAAAQVSRVELAIVTAEGAEADARAAGITLEGLLRGSEAEFAAHLDAIRRCRTEAVRLEQVVGEAIEFATRELALAADRLGSPNVPWTGGPIVDAPSAVDLVKRADVIGRLASRLAGEAESGPVDLDGVSDLEGLTSLLRARLADIRRARAIAERARDFLEEVRVFMLSDAAATADASAWLRGLGPAEVGVIVSAFDADDWPLCAAAFARLAAEAAGEALDELEARLVRTTDRAVRRDLLHLLDPESASFDGRPALRRMITVERMRDVMAFGPLALVTDPGTGFTDETVVGVPVAELTRLLIRNMDQIGSTAELRILASSGDRADRTAEAVGAELLTYATTPSTSSGFYFQLREAVRERHFLPLVRRGRLDLPAVRRVAPTFDVEEAIEAAVEEVLRQNVRGTRIEPRHRLRIQRYVRHGKELLGAVARATAPRKETRALEFAEELRSALAQLDRGSTDVGSIQWLESEIATLFAAGAEVPDGPTLRGLPGALMDQQWPAVETAWAQRTSDLPDFYLPGPVPMDEVLVGALRRWALDRSFAACDLLDDLIGGERFRAALAYAEEASVPEDERTALRERALTAGTEATERHRLRLSNIVESYGEQLVGTLSSFEAASRALDEMDVSEAVDQLDFLEMEAAEQSELRRRDALDATQIVERTALLRKLLVAGVEGPDERWSLEDLEARWTTELGLRASERAHLRVLERTLESPDLLQELTPDVAVLATAALEPENWLPADRANELASYLEAPADKLRTWLRLADQLPAPQRAASIDVTRWFVSFVREVSTGMRALDHGQTGDPILERVLEAGEAIEQASDPLSCAMDLGLDAPDLELDRSVEPARAASPTALRQASPAVLMPLIERQDWSALGTTARALRLEGDDEEAGRMADLAEFADVLDGLEGEGEPVVPEALVTAARVLGGGSYMVGRALPARRMSAIAFGLVAASLAGPAFREDAHQRQIGVDGSWSPLMRAGLMQALTGSGVPTRVVEQLCSGSLGREVVNRIWDVPTAKSEPGALRAALLSFLNERGLAEHLLFLAGRHDPSIKARLAQLLELRAIAGQRPDLVPVAEAVASQIAKAAQGVPFRNFVLQLPSATQATGSELVVAVDGDILLRMGQRQPSLSVGLSIEPRGLVPELLEAILFPDDDVSFEDGGRRRQLSDQPVYFASQWPVEIRFGPTWTEGSRRAAESFRIRVNARVLTGELVTKDVVCQLTRAELDPGRSRRIDDDTLLDAFPGVENTPALGDSFIGRHEEIERLHGNLVQARRPSPVLLTGMRRIGKTSLLYAFHDRHRQPRRDEPITIYFSIAERRAALMDRQAQVASVFFSSIVQALGKRHFSSTDLNRELGLRLRDRLGSDKGAVRNELLSLWDPDSFTDSLLALSEGILEWSGGATRVIYLVDEAETLVLPFRGGEAKRLELEQLMQGLREVAQTSPKVGILLSGSNHIAEFARSYKNAFFGSSLRIDLAGMTEPETASRLVSPPKLAPYLDFGGDPVRYAIDMCAGMPQFLWQLGATIAAIVRSGPVTTSDVRHAVSALVGERSVDLPFNAYDVLEPIEHMLGLQGQREQDLLWLLLWRVANSSSLVVREAQQNFIVDQPLLELDELEGWRNRLLALVDLEILEMPRPSMYRFRVPIFAEGFRAQRQLHSYQMRLQRAAT